MSSEKRLILFTIVTFVSILALQYAMDLAGLVPPPVPPVAEVEEPTDKDRDRAAEAAARGELVIPDNPFVNENRPVEPPKPEPKRQTVALVDVNDLVLGSTVKNGPYRLEVVLEQKGAGVASVGSAVYDAEFEPGKPKSRPLQILKYDPLTPPSLALTLVTPRDPSVDPDEAAAAGLPPSQRGELPLDGIVWEVVRDEQKRVVRPIAPGATLRTGQAPRSKAGQAVVFRTRVDELGLTLTKTFRLFEGEDGFDVDLTFESPEQTRSVVYKLLGPHGIPIEGEWYTGTFREAVFSMGGTKVVTRSASDIVKQGSENPERFQAQPLHFLGIENQYFASILEPDPIPASDQDRWDAEATAIILHVDPEAKQKADISVELTSKPLTLGPNLGATTHAYRVFAGPKTAEQLAPYHAEALAKYHKNQWFQIPLAPELSQYIIAPLLDSTYEATRVVSRWFGGKAGNYGISIILLTMLVRLAMFPLSRKQALSAKKMQDLQPQLKEIQEKYKDDKERQGKEVWAFYNRHGINPVKGCLPALIQLPIFVGLWQTLNNSVHLRHASFLYIQDLSAPDMLFHFPTPIPFLGDYFNLLPFGVVALMLVQTKLFSPPATTPEAEAQQKMMKYMMVFMAFMFYKVPSGLGLYFITSSLWQISERLLLPRVTHTHPAGGAGGDNDGKNPPPGDNNGGGGGGGRGGNNGSTPGPDKPPGRFGQFMQKVLEEAQKNPTYRNLSEEKDRTSRDRDRDRDRRDKGKPRAKPGRRR